jgi:RNA polymerase sigma-70 factor (ECF subfamily)
LFQEAFLKLHRARSSYVPGGPALHWAFAIVRTTWLDRLRYRKRRPESVAETEEALAAYDATPGSASSGTPEELARARQVARIIEAAVAKLPESQRDAYVLIREEGLAVADAARVLGATPTAVKLRAHRAYEAIRHALREAGFDDGAAAGEERSS